MILINEGFWSKLRRSINKSIFRDVNLKKLHKEIPFKFESSVINRNEAKIFWWRGGSNNKNFGDLITSYIYQKIKGKKPAWCNKKNTKEPVYFGSGSIIGLCKGWKNVVIWGSGIMNSDDSFDRPNKILCVRGPLTRKRFLELGYDCPEIYGDIGLLLPNFYQPLTEKKIKIGIIPHFTDYELCKKLFSDMENFEIIDVGDDVESVVDQICKCERTMSSSLHGIIVSHAYNIKSCWVKFSDNLFDDSVKFLDYYYSINLNEVKEPVMIGQEFLSQDNNVLNLIKIIENYPNPNFPINTDKLMKTCPF